MIRVDIHGCPIGFEATRNFVRIQPRARGSLLRNGKVLCTCSMLRGNWLDHAKPLFKIQGYNIELPAAEELCCHMHACQMFIRFNESLFAININI